MAARLRRGVAFPYLLLLVSGGHCAAAGLCRRRRLPAARHDRDDAAGEAFDKTAKLLGLGYPGGPAIERAARGGDPRRFALPRPLQGTRRLRFLVLRAEDGGAADRGRMDARRSARAAGRRRSRRRGRGGDLPTRWSTAPRKAVAWFRRHYPAAATPGRRRRGRGQRGGCARACRARRRRPGSPSSRRRRRCAPTTAR